MLFCREEIHSESLSGYKPKSSVKTIFTEINLRSKKRLLSANLAILNNHIQNMSRGLDLSKYYNFIVLEDFNAETSITTPQLLNFVRLTI